MKRVYLDNAATTPMDPEVLDAMLPYFREDFGNPSSTHAFGRKTKSAIELARKNIAGYLHAKPAEIIFTSGGTEADNMAIHTAIHNLGVKHIISSPIEHHAVLHTIEEMCKQTGTAHHMVKLDAKGHVDLQHLEALLQQHANALVSLMHANNEIGNLLPIKQVGELCAKYNAYFHSDTVQTMGHFPIDTQKINVHFLTCGAHKFHGPKGVGFLFRKENIKIDPLIHGGAQERNLRGGTENLYGIVGMAKAFEIAHRDMQEHIDHIQEIKNYMIMRLQETVPGIAFNGDYDGSSLYTVLSASFPPSDNASMLIFNLDILGVAASGGSACSSGSDKGSHVLTAIGSDPNRPTVRFSFSKYTTKSDIDFAIEKVTEVCRMGVRV